MESDKPIKICHFCHKEVRNLGLHISNQHPNILAQLDEYADTGKINPQVPQTPPTPQIYGSAPKGDINALIREKLDTMLNIKIIEMLSSNPNVSIQELQQTLNPPPKTTIQELKELHDTFYPESKKDLSDIQTGNQWVDVALQALPIAKEMFSNIQKKPLEEKQNVRTREETNTRILRPISVETSRDSREPSSPAQEPGNTSEPKQQDNPGINPTG